MDKGIIFAIFGTLPFIYKSLPVTCNTMYYTKINKTRSRNISEVYKNILFIKIAESCHLRQRSSSVWFE